MFWIWIGRISDIVGTVGILLAWATFFVWWRSLRKLQAITDPMEMAATHRIYEILSGLPMDPPTPAQLEEWALDKAKFLQKHYRSAFKTLLAQRLITVRHDRVALVQDYFSRSPKLGQLLGRKD